MNEVHCRQDRLGVNRALIELVSMERGPVHYSPAHSPLFSPHFRCDLARHVASKIAAEMGRMVRYMPELVQKPRFHRDELGGVQQELPQRP